MNAKSLLISSDTVETLTFEQVFDKYQALMVNSIKSYIDNFGYDDMYQVASMGLWRAYRDYDLSKYKVGFGYYAAIVIKNYIRMNYRNHKRSVNDALSLNSIIDTKDEDIEYIDRLEDNYNLENAVISRIGLIQALKNLEEKERIYLLLSLNGIEQKEIARRYDTLQPTVSRVIIKAKKKIKDSLYLET